MFVTVCCRASGGAGVRQRRGPASVHGHECHRLSAVMFEACCSALEHKNPMASKECRLAACVFVCGRGELLQLPEGTPSRRRSPQRDASQHSLCLSACVSAFQHTSAHVCVYVCEMAAGRAQV